VKLLCGCYGKQPGVAFLSIENNKLVLTDFVLTKSAVTHLLVHDNKIYATAKHSGENPGGVGYLNQNGWQDFLATPGVDYAHFDLSSDSRYLIAGSFHQGILSSFDLLTPELKLRDTLQHQGHSIHPTRQQSSHIHFVKRLEDKRIAAVDLGLDAIFFYRLNQGRLDYQGQMTLSAGSGPRQVALFEGQPLAFVAHEINNTITICDTRKPFWTAMSSVSSLPDDFTGDSSLAAIKWQEREGELYVSNRGYDSVVCYRFDDNQLSNPRFITTAAQPRDIFVIEDYLLAACQSGGVLQLFERHSGKLLDHLSLQEPVVIIAA